MRKTEDTLNSNTGGETPSREAPSSSLANRILLVLSILGIIGCILILLSTRWGAAVSDDTFRYVASARGLAEGYGLSWPTPEGRIPLTGYPPLFTITLTSFELAGIDAVQGLRFLNAALFGLTIFLTGLLVDKVTRVPGFSVLSATFMLSSKVLLETNSAALSEPLYFVLATTSIVFLVSHIENRKIVALLGAGLAAGLAFLTRYFGLSLVLAVGLVLILGNQRSWRWRLKDAFLFCVLSMLPMIVWIVRNLVLIGSATNRSMAWHPPTAGWFEGGMRTILLWFVPGRMIQGNVFLFFGVFLCSILIFVYLMILWNRYRGPLLPGAAIRGVLAFFVSYSFMSLGVLYLARSLVATPVPLDDRLLAPVHHAILMLLPIVLAVIWRNTSLIPRTLIVVFCCVFFLLYAYRAVQSVQYMHQQGLGYTSRGWHSSEAMEVIQTHPDLPVFSNAAAAIYFWTDRVTYPLLSLNQMRPYIEQDCAVVVAFDAIPLSLYRLSHEGLSQELIGNQIGDGWLYQHPGCTDLD